MALPCITRCGLKRPSASNKSAAILTAIAILALSGSNAECATSVTDFDTSTPLLVSAFGVRPPGSTSSPSVGNDNSAKTYGYSFTTTLQNLTVTHLGMFTPNGTNGFSQAHRVGLWTAAGALLAEVQFDAGPSGILSGTFRYAALGTPLTLNLGSTYVLGAYYPQATFPIDPVVSNIYVPAAADGFSLGTTQFRFGQNMPFPNTVTINKPYVGPTLRFQTVPEPSCLLVTFSAAAGLVFRRKRASCLITAHRLLGTSSPPLNRQQIGRRPQTKVLPGA